MERRLLIALTVTFAYGQDSLALRDAVRQAMARSKILEASAAASDATVARITEANSGRLPKVNYSESWTRSDNPVFVFSSLLTQRRFGRENFDLAALNRPDFANNFRSVLSADQPLYDAGNTKRSTRIARFRRDISRADLRRSEMEVIATVVRLYYDAKLGREQVKLSAQAMRSAEADLQRAEARRDSGMATDADVLSIRVHMAMIREQQIRHSALVTVADAALNDAMGSDLDVEHLLTTALAPLPLPQMEPVGLERTAIDVHPDTRQTRLAEEITKIEAANARSLLLPQIALHGAFEAARQQPINRGGSNWLVSIGLQWNLFNGNADKARIAEAHAMTRNAAADRSRSESAIRLRVREAWANLKAAQQRIDSARAPVAEAQESLRISQNRFASGLATVTDLLRTEVALLETQTRYAAAVHDQRIAAAMLDFAAGTLNPESEVLH